MLFILFTACDLPCIPLLDFDLATLFIGGDGWDGRVQGNCFCEIEF